MKKIIILIVILVGIISLTKRDSLTIPKEAIRFRVIANSDTKEDQDIKLEVKETVEQNLYSALLKAENIDSARSIITKNIPEIENTVNNTLLNNNFNYGSKVNFGNNYFPVKEFKGITYNQGNYESLVITLGKGAGNNWWCVLFPPLCLLEAEESDTNEVEYQFFVKKLIDKYMK